MRTILLLACACLALACCVNGGDTAAGAQQPEEQGDSAAEREDTLYLFEEEEVPKAADELFDDFFFSFISDNAFQLRRVRFPLECREGGEVLRVSRNDWKQFSRFSSQAFYSVIYERDADIALQKDTSVSEVGVEWIYLDENYVERYNFRRTAGQWQLVNFEKDETTRTPHASFAHFFAQFSSDSVFQRESLRLPLRLVSEAQAEDDEGSVEELTADEWFEFRKEMPLPENIMTNIDYGQAAFSQNRKTLLVEELSSGLFVKYKFDRMQGKWWLIEIDI